MRALLLAALGAVLAAPAQAGLACVLTYTCIAEGCEPGEIQLRLAERDGGWGVVSGEEFTPVARNEDASGWTTFTTPVMDGEVYFLSLLPDGTAMASGHVAGGFGDEDARNVYGATGTCTEWE